MSKNPPKKPPSDRSRETRDVGLTILAVVIAVWAGVAWLTPLVIAAPLAFYLARGAAADAGLREFLSRRWAITVLVMYLAATTFSPPHAIASVPFAAGIPEHITAWLDGTAGPLLGARYMLVAGLATLILTVATAGIAGALVLGSILAINGVAGTVLVSRGYNIIQMAFVAISPWQWCFMVGLVALYTPLSVLSRSRILGRDGAPFNWNDYRTRILTGAGLLLLAFIVRFALAGAYAHITRAITL